MTASSVPGSGGSAACSRCGEVHPKCAGHNKTTGKPCGSNPVNGTTVCRMHGGSLPVVKKAARERHIMSLTEGKVAKLLAEVDMPAQHPLDGLLEVVRHSGAMMRMLGGLVGELDLHPGEETLYMGPEGDILRGKALYGPDHSGDAAPHVLLSLYGLWSDRYARACKLALDANIDERLVRNAESTSEKMFTAITKAIAAAELSDVQRAKLQGAMAAELRRFAGAVADDTIEGEVVG